MSPPLSVSVVVITKDEAPRLALTLAALEHDARAHLEVEIVVVDDGSTDATTLVLDEASRNLPIRQVRHEVARGRAAARNAGAKAASKDVLLFCDGDCLLGPGTVAEHHAAFESPDVSMARGHTMHLRCTRFFHDPEVGAPMAGAEERVSNMKPDERARALVTRAMVRGDFGAIDARAEPGIYPGAGPRRLYELEVEAFASAPPLSCLWMAVPAQNMAIRRSVFVKLGGFDERMTLNEHRELALRVHEMGGRIVLVGGRSYHMTHRMGFRDPVRDDMAWEKQFYDLHPTHATKLMAVFWQSVGGDPHIPPWARIQSLKQFDEVVRGGRAAEYAAVRTGHPILRPLG
jgi:glycosyltransferase involved in cell wall biosynthesis